MPGQSEFSSLGSASPLHKVWKSEMMKVNGPGAALAGEESTERREEGAWHMVGVD